MPAIMDCGVLRENLPRGARDEGVQPAVGRLLHSWIQRPGDANARWSAGCFLAIRFCIFSGATPPPLVFGSVWRSPQYPPLLGALPLLLRAFSLAPWVALSLLVSHRSSICLSTCRRTRCRARSLSHPLCQDKNLSESLLDSAREPTIPSTWYEKSLATAPLITWKIRGGWTGHKKASMQGFRV